MIRKRVAPSAAAKAARPRFSVAAIVLAGVSALALLTAMPAGAADDVATQRELLRQMKAKPGNHELTFEYARVSTAIGDYEAAIGALEKLLFYNPTLTRVKYELGALYYKLGSHDVAARYFREALASNDLDADTRSRITAYLPEVEKELATSRSWFFAQAGIRYQSNASYTPTSGTIMVDGFPETIDLTGPHGDDWNVFGIAQFANDTDFGGQAGHKFETRITGYATEQFKLEDLNVATLSGTFGPRFALATESLPGLSVKPYFLASGAWLGGELYSASYGGGLTFGIPVNKRISFAPNVSWQTSDYDQGGTTANYGSGDLVTASLAGKFAFAETVWLDASVGYRSADGDEAWQDYSGWTASAALNVLFDPPVASIPYKWTVTPFVKWSQTDFGAANPYVDPSTRRSDNALTAGATLNAPLTAHLGLAMLGQYEVTDSNISNYESENWSFLLGPTLRY